MGSIMTHETKRFEEDGTTIVTIYNADGSVYQEWVLSDENKMETD